MIAKSNHRMPLCCILLGLLLAFIWGNSLLPGSASSAFSNWVKALLHHLFPFLFSGSSGGGGGLLRKVAHFTEFAALGACFGWLYGMLRPRQVEQILFTVFSGFLAACVDETIQRFVPGRNGCLTDVGIDTAGVITGIILFTAGYLIIKKKQHHLEEIT